MAIMLHPGFVNKTLTDRLGRITGTTTVAGFTSDCGLALYEDANGPFYFMSLSGSKRGKGRKATRQKDTAWQVTHNASGLWAATVATKELAEELIEQLSGLTNWHLSFEELARLETYKQLVEQVQALEASLNANWVRQAVSAGSVGKRITGQFSE